MYYARIDESIKYKEDCWDELLVGIYKKDQPQDEELRVGEYIRNYPALRRSFYPFIMNGKDYALYSPDYTTTRVMSLPECKDLGGEERSEFGFCPVDYYVHVTCTGYLLGFVAGCVWGDDSDWKVQYLDLRRADQGIIQREPKRFGYLSLPNDLHLAECLEITDDSDEEEVDVTICIKTYKEFWWGEKEMVRIGRVKERGTE